MNVDRWWLSRHGCRATLSGIARLKYLLSSFACFGALACGGGGGDEADLPEVDCDSPVPTYAEVEVFHSEGNLCAQCHSTELSGTERSTAAGQVPSAINTDDYASASAFAELIVEEVYEGAMPPPGLGYTITDEQKQQVYQWGLCGAPE